jgi:hypothetical protein
VWKKLPVAVVWALIFCSCTFSQRPFPPRNSDEADAWRLHDEYVASEKKQRELQAAIQRKSIEAGAPGPAQNNQAALEVNRLFGEFAAQTQLQLELEQAWNKRFSARYGDLRESSLGVYDPALNTSMDRIQFRLIHFPFYPNDGTYHGSIAEVPGEITLIIQGTTVTGTISGLYFYRVDKLIYTEVFSGTIEGTISIAGAVDASLSGEIGRMAFTGSLSGRVVRGVARGNWTTEAMTVESGTFKANRNQ